MQPTEIREFRKAMGLTQQALADLLGVTRKTVTRWEMEDRTAPEARAPEPYLRLALERLNQPKNQVEN